MSAEAYLNTAADTLRDLARTQLDTLRQAASVLADAVLENRAIYAFGATHSFILAAEMVYRTGGLMLVNPIYPHGMDLSVRPLTMTSQLERLPGLGAELLAGSPATCGDVLLVASTSGRNAVAIDMALAAQAQGMHTIAITSLAYTRAVTSRHPSGKKVADVCDIVLDNGAPHGDAVVDIKGFPQRVAPLSSVTGCALVNALAAEVVQILVEAGVTPPVFVSANLDGGDEHNARLLEENRHRIHYME